MSAFHLHARLVEGCLGAFSRNETRARATETWDDAEEAARDLVADGFTVWIYEHGPPPSFSTASDLRVVSQQAPGPQA